MRFQCTACHQCYEDNRFIWEELGAFAADGSDELSGASAQRSRPSAEAVAHPYSPEIFPEPEIFRQHQDSLADKLDEAEAASQADSEETSAGSTASALLEPSWDASSVASLPECERQVQTQGRAIMFADVFRVAGTTAKLTAACGESHLMCGPLAVAGSAVGLTAGCTQLRRGLSTPSGLIDRHLVTKGAVVTGVGATNVCICVKATLMACPHLFAAALALSVVNAGVASTLDTHMNGLCSACREGPGPQDPGLECDVGPQDPVVECDAAAADVFPAEGFLLPSSCLRHVGETKSESWSCFTR